MGLLLHSLLPPLMDPTTHVGHRPRWYRNGDGRLGDYPVYTLVRDYRVDSPLCFVEGI